MADIAAGDAKTGSAFAEASLSDRFDLDRSRVLITGTQAIVRMLLMQKEADRRAGLNTAGFVTGYRGSPLGGVDAQMHKAKALFDANNILHARAQRGSRRDRHLGRAAGRDARRRQI